MAQAWKVRLEDGRVLVPGEWSSTPLYSTVEIDDGAIQPLQGFSYGLGGDVPGSVGPRSANEADTNLEGPGAILAENEELLLFTIMVELFITTTDDAASADFFTANADLGPGDPPTVSLENAMRVLCDTILVLRIAHTKEYCRAPLGFFPAAMGTYHWMGEARAENNAGANVLLGTNGNPSAGTNRAFSTPHRVAPGEAFEISLEFPNGQVNNLELGNDASARVRARIYADGYRRRPVA